MRNEERLARDADAAQSIPHSAFRIPHSRILLADDNADMRDYVRRLLAANCDVEAVTDGEAALEAARERPPDLILTDVMMPKLDGFEACRAIKRDADLAGTPVILLSAKARDIDQKQGYEAGADDYITKPFSPGRLVDRVHGLLKQKA